MAVAPSTDKTVGVVNQTVGAVSVDVSEMTRDDGTAVERQRVSIADPLAGEDKTGLMAGVVGERDRGALRVRSEVAVLDSIDEKLGLILELLMGLAHESEG